jgi:ribosomal protein L7Ae-like RNA K-turn-binding protein
MPEFELSTHAREMLRERKIAEEWVQRVLETPSRKKKAKDGNIHYTKPIREKDGRVLRVIVNPDVDPQRVVTLFFDRRLGK